MTTNPRWSFPSSSLERTSLLAFRRSLRSRCRDCFGCGMTLVSYTKKKARFSLTWSDKDSLSQLSWTWCIRNPLNRRARWGQCLSYRCRANFPQAICSDQHPTSTAPTARTQRKLQPNKKHYARKALLTLHFASNRQADILPEFCCAREATV